MKKKKNTKKVWKVIGIGIGIGILVIFIAIIVYLFRITHITIGEDFIKSKNNVDLIQNELISSYSEYESLGLKTKLKEKDFENYNYVVFNTENGNYMREFNFVPTGYKLNDGVLKIDITYASYCDYDILAAVFHSFIGLNPRTYLLKLDKNIKISDVNYHYINKNKYLCSYEYNGEEYTNDKPLIYIYPTNDMNVKVTLGYPEKLTTTYPQYNDSWDVYAKTDGTLTDSDGKEYYGLYWEGVRKEKIEFNNGFVVSREDLIPFLEEKLAILGLNARESNEFIIYWLPRLQKNKYNLIRFATKEEIEKEMPLNITPEPETLIRVFMEFKGLDKNVTINEQELNKVERNGYTVVEWGGSEQKK